MTGFLLLIGMGLAGFVMGWFACASRVCDNRRRYWREVDRLVHRAGWPPHWSEGFDLISQSDDELVEVLFPGPLQRLMPPSLTAQSAERITPPRASQ